RPLLTLTYAQSLDGKIAAAGRRPLRLSGRESMIMTHALRAKHDAILVGVGTVLADDPQLNVRLLPPPAPSASSSGLQHGRVAWPSPLPLILDTHLRLPVSSRLLSNHRAGTGRQPLIFGAALELPHPAHPEMRARKARLSEAGAEVLELPLLETGLSLLHLLQTLHARGITSLMVEGGQRVLSSFLAQGLLDLLVVTVAPVMVGPDGVGFVRETGPARGRVPRLSGVRTQVFGRDAVMALVPEVLEEQR
ncbi:bacterial bifunctional deaminase-reductase, partial [Calocera cornea HHB12733]